MTGEGEFTPTQSSATRPDEGNEEVLYTLLQPKLINDQQPGESGDVHALLRDLTDRVAKMQKVVSTQGLKDLSASREQDSHRAIQFDELTVTNSDVNQSLNPKTCIGKIKVKVLSYEIVLALPKAEYYDEYTLSFMRKFDVALEHIKQLYDLENKVFNARLFELELERAISSEALTTFVHLEALYPGITSPMRVAIEALLADQIRKDLFTEIQKKYQNVKVVKDMLTPGGWITSPRKDDVLPASRKRVLVPLFKFDARQTQNLIAITFSKSPGQSAEAKLNLYSKLELTICEKVKESPKAALTRVIAEADLTQQELIHMIFVDQRTSKVACPSCEQPIKLEDKIMFHPRCEVANWLVENFFFIYNDEESYLSARTAIYIDGTQRLALKKIQMQNAKLNNPVNVAAGNSHAQVLIAPQGNRKIREFPKEQWEIEMNRPRTNQGSKR